MADDKVKAFLLRGEPCFRDAMESTLRTLQTIGFQHFEYSKGPSGKQRKVDLKKVKVELLCDQPFEVRRLIEPKVELKMEPIAEELSTCETPEDPDPPRFPTEEEAVALLMSSGIKGIIYTADLERELKREKEEEKKKQEKKKLKEEKREKKRLKKEEKAEKKAKKHKESVPLSPIIPAKIAKK